MLSNKQVDFHLYWTSYRTFLFCEGIPHVKALNSICILGFHLFDQCLIAERASLNEDANKFSASEHTQQVDGPLEQWVCPVTGPMFTVSMSNRGKHTAYVSFRWGSHPVLTGIVDHLGGHGRRVERAKGDTTVAVLQCQTFGQLTDVSLRSCVYTWESK